jgi:hypothetical protein
VVDKSTLDRCLEGITFPAEARTVADCAQVNACPSDVISQIRDSSAGTFGSEEQVWSAPRYEYTLS